MVALGYASVSELIAAYYVGVVKVSSAGAEDSVTGVLSGYVYMEASVCADAYADEDD